MTIKAEVVTMAPTEAMRLLQRQKEDPVAHNRHITQHRVDQYALQMKAGKWELNGQPILLDEDEQLLDGQHRLLACVTAETPFKTLIVRGVDRKVFPTIDTGKIRNGGDVLSIAGYANASTLSSALTWLYLYDQKKMLWKPPQAGWSHALQFEILKRYPLIVDSVQWANRSRRHHILMAIPPAPLSFLHYVFSKHNEALCEEFFKRVGDEEPDRIDSGTRTLRHYLITSLRGAKHRTLDLIAYSVKAWAAHVESKPIKILRWTRFGPGAEDFPLFPGENESRGVSLRTMSRMSIEDAIKFLKERLSEGPQEGRKIKAEAKKRGIPIHDIVGSASMKKIVGIVSRRQGAKTMWALA